VTAARGAALAALLALAAPATLAAQSLEQRVLAVRDGTVRLAYATKPGVCASGDGGVTIRSDARDGWEGTCEPGPAHVALRLRGGRVAGISTHVGGRWTPASDVVDLGTVPAAEATKLFLALARRDDAGAKDAVFPALIAEGADPWRELLSLARDGRVRTDARKAAVFWVSQEAGAAATRGLADLVGDDAMDRDVRESAVFALSQRPAGEGVPALLEVARSSDDPKLRKSAIFWLGQSEDPRALAYFEQVLAKPGR
jgi:hypothetical protein